MNMRKILYFLFIFLVSFLLISCDKLENVEPVVEDEIYFYFDKVKVNVNMDEEVILDVVTNYDGIIEYYASSPIVKLDGNKVTGVFPGTCYVFGKVVTSNEILEEKVIVNVIGDKKVSDCFVNFTLDQMDAKVGEKVKLPIETDYPYDLAFSASTYYKIEDGYITFNDDGKFTISAFFIYNGKSYGDTIIISSKYEKEYVSIIIDDETYEIAKGSKLSDFLRKTYNNELYIKEPGTLYDGYYYDLSYQVHVDLNMIVEEPLEIHLHLIKEEYTIKVNKVIGFYQSFAFDDEVVCISPSCKYKATQFDLNDYVYYAIKYNLECLEYVVMSKGKKVLYPDGFLLCIRKDYSNLDKVSELLQVGCKVYLDHYTINRCKNIIINKELEEDVETVDTLDVTCSYATIYDATNHKWIYNKNAYGKAYPASTTKIITAITALTYCPIDTEYVIGDELDLCYEGDSPSVAGFDKGETWTLRDLLYAMLLPSGNDAAYSVAACTMHYLNPESKASMRSQIDEFARMMNDIGKEVGATGSSFRVPDGNSYYHYGAWDDRLTYHYVTAHDMALFANYAFRFGAIAEIVKTSSYTAKTKEGKIYTLNSTNALINGTSYTFAVGMKTGTTNPAQYCLIAGAWRNGRLIITSCLKSTSSNGRYTDTIKMFKAVFGN